MGTNPITPLVNTWNPTTKTLSIVSDRHLPAFSIDSYTIVVNSTAPAGISASAADCSEDGAGHGFYNLATATSGGRTATADACGAGAALAAVEILQPGFGLDGQDLVTRSPTP